MEELQRHHKQTCVNTVETTDVQNERTKPTLRDFVVYNLWPRANCCVFVPQELLHVACSLLLTGHVDVATHFWKSRFEFAFGRKKKVRFFEFLVSCKN